MKRHAEELDAEKNKIKDEMGPDEILEIMFRRNVKGTLEPNMFGQNKEI